MRPTFGQSIYGGPGSAVPTAVSYPLLPKRSSQRGKEPIGTNVGRAAITLFVAVCCSSPNSSDSSCDPGLTRACVGAEQCPGGQYCIPDGSGWSACDCGTGGDSSPGGQAGAEGLGVSSTGNAGGSSGSGAGSSGGTGSGAASNAGGNAGSNGTGGSMSGNSGAGGSTSGGTAGNGTGGSGSGGAGGTGGSDPSPSCIPGATEFCECANVPRGARACDGFGDWGPCECAEAACDGLTWAGWFSSSAYCTNFFTPQTSGSESCTESLDGVPILRCCCCTASQ